MWTLARKLLLHDRLRFVVAIAGVSVSVMLVLVQVGLYFGFMDTASSLIDASKADIWVGKKSNDSFEFATKMYVIADPPITYFKGRDRYRDLAVSADGRRIYAVTTVYGRTTTATGELTSDLAHAGALIEFNYEGSASQ